MSETHVNSYANELVAARDNVVKAVGEYEAAKEALKAQPGYDASMLVRLPFELLYPTDVKPKEEAKASEAKV